MKVLVAELVGGGRKLAVMQKNNELWGMNRKSKKVALPEVNIEYWIGDGYSYERG